MSEEMDWQPARLAPPETWCPAQLERGYAPGEMDRAKSSVGTLIHVRPHPSEPNRHCECQLFNVRPEDVAIVRNQDPESRVISLCQIWTD